MKAVVDKILSPSASRPLPTTGWIRSLDADEIPTGYLLGALGSVSQVAEELGMDPETVTVTCFAPCAPDHPGAARLRGVLDCGTSVNGFVNGEQHIFLSAALASVQLLSTAAHETRHLWQQRRGWQALHGRPFLEHDARTFGYSWAARRLHSEARAQLGEAAATRFRGACRDAGIGDL